MTLKLFLPIQSGLLTPYMRTLLFTVKHPLPHQISQRILKAKTWKSEGKEEFKMLFPLLSVLGQKEINLKAQDIFSTNLFIIPAEKLLFETYIFHYKNSAAYT